MKKTLTIIVLSALILPAVSLAKEFSRVIYINRPTWVINNGREDYVEVYKFEDELTT